MPNNSDCQDRSSVVLIAKDSNSVEKEREGTHPSLAKMPVEELVVGELRMQ